MPAPLAFDTAQAHQHLARIEPFIAAVVEAASHPTVWKAAANTSHAVLEHKHARAKAQDQINALVEVLQGCAPADWNAEAWSLKLLGKKHTASWSTSPRGTGAPSCSIAIAPGPLAAWAGTIIGAAMLAATQPQRPTTTLWRVASAHPSPSAGTVPFGDVVYADATPIGALAQAFATGMASGFGVVSSAVHAAFLAGAHKAFHAPRTHLTTSAPSLTDALANHPVTQQLQGFSKGSINLIFLQSAVPVLRMPQERRGLEATIAAFEESCRTLLTALDAVALPTPQCGHRLWAYDPRGLNHASTFQPSVIAWSVESAAVGVALGELGLTEAFEHPNTLRPHMHAL